MHHSKKGVDFLLEPTVSYKDGCVIVLGVRLTGYLIRTWKLNRATYQTSERAYIIGSPTNDRAQ